MSNRDFLSATPVLRLEPYTEPPSRPVSFGEAFVAGAVYGATGDAAEVGAGLFDYEASRRIRDWYQGIEQAEPWAANAGEFVGGLFGGPVAAAARVLLGWIADGMIGEPPDAAVRILEMNGLMMDQVERWWPSPPGRDLFAAGADLTNEAIDARNIVEGYGPATLLMLAQDQDRHPPRVGPNDMQLLAQAIGDVYRGAPIHDQAALPPAYWFGGVEADLGSPAAEPFDFRDLGLRMFPESFYSARGMEPMLPFFLPADPLAENYFFFPAGTDYEAAWADVMAWRRARSLYPR